MGLFSFLRRRKYTAKKIVKQLDECAKEYTFPRLNNESVQFINAKLTAYRDKTRWAIVIEVLGVSSRGAGHSGISNCLYVFGNCIGRKPGTHVRNFIFPTDNYNTDSTFDTEKQSFLNPDAEKIKVRWREIPIQHDREFYNNKGIVLENETTISIAEFVRGLIPEYKTELFATNAEIEQRIPYDLPCVVTIENWKPVDKQLPSENETILCLAKQLESGK